MRYSVRVRHDHHILLAMLNLDSATGVGAFASPLIATQFAQLPRHWSLHYLTTLGFAIINNVLVVVIFKYKTQEGEYTSFARVVEKYV